MSQPAAHTFFVKAAKSAGIFVVLLVGAYIINVQIQSYLGRNAAVATGLPTHTFEQALSLAKQQGKPVLANFSAAWCPACRRLDKEVLAKTEVKQRIEQRYIFTRIDYDTEEGQTFMARYQAKGTPTLLILDAQGEQLKRLNLTFTPAQFLTQL